MTREGIAPGMTVVVEGENIVLGYTDETGYNNLVIFTPRAMAAFMHWTAAQEALRPIWNRYLMEKLKR